MIQTQTEELDGLDSLRLWISDQQWLSILERIERASKEYQGVERRELRDCRFPKTFRCLIRLGHPGDAPGTYLIRTRNISSGGLGFVHGHDIPAGTRCTIALQSEDGRGQTSGARIAWSRPLTPDRHGEPAYDIGVEFDQPVDVVPFVDDAA